MNTPLVILSKAKDLYSLIVFRSFIGVYPDILGLPMTNIPNQPILHTI